MATPAAPAPADATGANVRVAVRARPLNKRERDLGCDECVVMDGQVTKVVDEAGRTKEFGFDFSYWYDTPQETVYNDLARPIIDASLDGFNGVIFAYGQTGSGKTHSMMGSGDDIGIVPRMNAQLFDLLNEKKERDGCETLVTASYLEIYNEVIRDLLNPSEKQLKVREHPKLGIYVENLAELVVEEAGGIARLLDQGNQVKQVAATQMNERSSRSHSCFVINVKQRKVEEIGSGDSAVKRETTLSSKINLVDLAGSERASKTGATGDRLKEGAAINKSLSALGEVISILADGSGKFVPYRNSKLTRVLQDALGGNARTVMIATISPADNNYAETISTLQYAWRAKKIKNKTVRNEDVSQRMIRELREEVERLRAQMAAMQGNGPASPGSPLASLSPEETLKMTDMQEKIAMLEETKKRQWDEVQKLSRAYEEEREKTMKNENLIREAMQSVKDEKVAILKRLKDLETEKTAMVKTLRQLKSDYGECKANLEADMKEYRSLSEVPAEERDKDAVKAVFARIEEGRNVLVEQRLQMKTLKDNIKANQDEQLEQRAELEAQKTILEGDENLRKAIQEEERAKLAEEIDGRRDELISQQLAEEKTRIETRAMKEMRTIEQKYRRKLTVAASRQSAVDDRAHTLEIQCIDLRGENGVLRREVIRLREKLREQDLAHAAERQRWEADKRQTVEQLLEAFKEDNARLAAALKQAASDCVAIAKEKAALEALLM